MSKAEITEKNFWNSAWINPNSLHGTMTDVYHIESIALPQRFHLHIHCKLHTCTSLLGPYLREAMLVHLVHSVSFSFALQRLLQHPSFR